MLIPRLTRSAGRLPGGWSASSTTSSLTRAALPPSYYAKARKQQGLHRIVCDYIAGMTDNYLSKQYGKHLGD